MYKHEGHSGNPLRWHSFREHQRTGWESQGCLLLHFSLFFSWNLNVHLLSAILSPQSINQFFFSATTLRFHSPSHYSSPQPLAAQMPGILREALPPLPAAACSGSSQAQVSAMALCPHIGHDWCSTELKDADLHCPSAHK